MSTPKQPTPFGRSYPPDETWLAKQPVEPILDPDLPIIDTHHHLWERSNHRYLLDEFLADCRTGHNIVATVFVECHSMYRASGPEVFRPVGETEFVAGVAAMSASGLYGPTRVAAGIVGFADLTLGDRVTPILEAHIRAGGGRFRGVRHAAAWDADPVIGNSRTTNGLHLFRQSDFRAGMARLTALGLSLDAWVFHPQLDDVIDLARAFPNATIISGHVGGPLGYGPYADKEGRGFCVLEKPHGRTGHMPQRRHEARGNDDAPSRLRLWQRARAPDLRTTRRLLASVYGNLY
jgi:L-fuconolactonase